MRGGGFVSKMYGGSGKYEVVRAIVGYIGTIASAIIGYNFYLYMKDGGELNFGGSLVTTMIGVQLIALVISFMFMIWNRGSVIGWVAKIVVFLIFVVGTPEWAYLEIWGQTEGSLFSSVDVSGLPFEQGLYYIYGIVNLCVLLDIFMLGLMPAYSSETFQS